MPSVNLPYQRCLASSAACTEELEAVYCAILLSRDYYSLAPSNSSRSPTLNSSYNFLRPYLRRLSSLRTRSPKAYRVFLRVSSTSSEERPSKFSRQLWRRPNLDSIIPRSLMTCCASRCCLFKTCSSSASIRSFSFLTQGALSERSFLAFATSISLACSAQTHSSNCLVLSMSSFSRSASSLPISFLPALMPVISSRSWSKALVFSSKPALSISFTCYTYYNSPTARYNLSAIARDYRSSNFSFPRPALRLACTCLFQLNTPIKCDKIACRRGAYVALPPGLSGCMKSVTLRSNLVSAKILLATRKSEMVGRDSLCLSRSSLMRWHQMASTLLMAPGSSPLMTSTMILSRFLPSRQCSTSPRSLVKLKPIWLRKARMRSKDWTPSIFDLLYRTHQPPIQQHIIPHHQYHVNPDLGQLPQNYNEFFPEFQRMV